MANEEIGAKIVLTGEDRGGSAVLKGATQETQNLGAATEKARDASGRFAAGQQNVATTAAAAARAEALLNTELKAATPDQLHAVVAELHELAESGKLSATQLGQVENKLKEIATEGGGRLKSILGGIGGELTSLAQNIPGVGQIGAVAGAAVPEVAALVAVLTTAVAALHAFSERQEHAVKLDTALAQNGLLVDSYREKLQSLAGQYGKLAGGSAAWLDTFTRLTQFGANESNIEKYAASVKNLTALMDGDVAGATQAFTRAMTGHTRALELLGIEVDKTLPKQQQLESIMSQLAERGAGQLENRNHTLAASFDRLTRAGSNFLPALGQILNSLFPVQGTMELLAYTLNFLGSAMGNTVPKMEGIVNKVPDFEHAGKAMVKTAEDAGDALENELGGGADAAKTATQQLATDGLTALSTAMESLTEKTRAANTELVLARKRLDELDDADLATQIATIKAGPGSEADKAKAERDARHASTARKQQRQDDEDAAKLRTLDADTTGKGRLAVDAGRDMRSAEGERDFLQKRRDDLKAKYDEAARRKPALDAYIGKPEEEAQRRADFGDVPYANAVAERHKLDRDMPGMIKQRDEIEPRLKEAVAKADAARQIYEKAKADADAAARTNASQAKAVTSEQDFRHELQKKQGATQTITESAEDQKRREAGEAEARAAARKEYDRIAKSGVGTDGKPLTVVGRRTLADNLDALDNADARAKPVAPGAAPIEARNRHAEQAERRQRILGDGASGPAGLDRPTAAEAEFGGLHGALSDRHDASMELHEQHMDNDADSSARHDTSQQDRAGLQQKINALEQLLKKQGTQIENLISRGKGP